MRKIPLGPNGPLINPLGFGCMSFAGFFGAANDDESQACLAAVEAAGVDFWDTANVYGMGKSESVIGDYLRGRTHNIKIATKAGIDVGPPRRFRNDADHVRSELEKSLTRLGQDSVSLFYLHRREQERPIEEAVEILVGLIEEGLIGGYGLSEIAPYTLRRAHAVHPCRAVQNEYSLWTRQPELGLIQTCAELGTTFVPFSPLARGFLTDTPVGPNQMADADFRRLIPRFNEPNYATNLANLAPFQAWCAAKGHSTAAVAMAWVLQQGDHIAPIPATRTVAHFNEWAGADDIALTAADFAEIAAILPVGWAYGDRYSDQLIVGIERYC